MNTQQLIDENNRLLAEIDRLKRQLSDLHQQHMADLRDMRREAISDAEATALQGGWME